MINYKELLKDINTLVFDFDGVMTNGQVFQESNGELIRGTNVKDGYALQLAAQQNYNIAIITGGKSERIKERLNNLGINDVFLNINNKKECLEAYIKEKNVAMENVLYMGDDIPDMQVMKEVAVPCCPKDASEEIKAISLWISTFKGGEGCVREAIEQVLKVHARWVSSNRFFNYKP